MKYIHRQVVNNELVRAVETDVRVQFFQIQFAQLGYLVVIQVSEKVCCSELTDMWRYN